MIEVINVFNRRLKQHPKQSYLVLIAIFIFFSFIGNSQADVNSINQSKVIAVLKIAEQYIKTNGIKAAIVEFKTHADDIFLADYSGVFFVSPLHPELIGKNQFFFKDDRGVFVVQEEIAKAKAGGGWLKGRWRQNPQTGKYACRKIYILPVSSKYFIGSWYHYSSERKEVV